MDAKTASVVSAVPQPQQLVAITIPAGVTPGQMLHVTAADGQVLQVQVPGEMQQRQLLLN